MNSAYDMALQFVLRLSNDVDSWLNVFSVIKKHEPDLLIVRKIHQANQLSLDITYFSRSKKIIEKFMVLKTNLKREVRVIDDDSTIVFTEQLT